MSYIDTDGTTQTLAASVYELRADDLDAVIVTKFGKSWPAILPGSRITVTAVAGYVSVPQEIVTAILIRIGMAFRLSTPDQMLKKRVTEGVGSREYDTTDGHKNIEASVAVLLENFRCWRLL